MDVDGLTRELGDDGSITVGAVDPRARGGQAVERGLGRVPVRIAGAGRCDGDLRPDGLDERLGRGRLASVVGHFEEIDVREVIAKQRGVDVLLDVTHQQHPATGHGAEQDHGDVVDARPAVGRLGGNLAADRPEHLEVDLVDVQAVTRRKTLARNGQELR